MSVVIAFFKAGFILIKQNSISLLNYRLIRLKKPSMQSDIEGFSVNL